MKKLFFILLILLFMIPAFALGSSIVGKTYYVFIDRTIYWLNFYEDNVVLTVDGMDTAFSYEYAEPFGRFAELPFFILDDTMTIVTQRIDLAEWKYEPEPEPEPEEPTPPPIPDNAVLFDWLLNGETIGRQSGGSFTDDGWKHTSAGNKLVYSFDSMTSGVVTFDVTNITNNSTGGGAEYDIYFGIYDDASGDKLADYTGAAFIEVRYNYTSRYPEKLKLLSGAGVTAHEIDERLCGNMSFDPNKTYTHKLVFGNGKVDFYLNGTKMISTTYKGTINWSHMFVGDTNYKGVDSSTFSGMKNFVYSNVLLTE